MGTVYTIEVIVILLVLFSHGVLLVNSTPTLPYYSNCGESSLSVRGRIIGGSVSRHGMWPWHIGLYKRINEENKLICGGALISNQWVLTAAHCFYIIKRSPTRVWHDKDVAPANKYSIVAGDHKIHQDDSSEQTRLVSEILIHPDYRHAPYYENDIALIKLNQSVTFSPYVRTICLPKKSERPLARPGRLVSVPGWGRSQHSKFSPILKYSVFRIQSNHKCDQATTYFFNSSVTFCSGDGKGLTDTCKGDSGGSLVRKVLRKGLYRWVTVGLVSWGEGCALKDKYGYNTRLEAFIDWIQPIIIPGCGNPGNIPHGRFSGSEFSISSRVVYHCSSGYEMKGKSSRKCKTNGKWTRAPVCQKDGCRSIIQRLANARRPKGTQLFFRRGSFSQVMYKCIAGYTFQDGRKSVIRRCVRGRLYGREPRCRASCSKPTSIFGGIRIGNVFHHGKTVKFQCFRQWTLAGAHVIMCKNGKWDFITPRCSPPCLSPVTPIGGYRIDNDFTHGKTVRFRCLGKRRLYGTPNITCNKGKWYSDPPKCLWGLCPDPGVPANGFRFDLDFRHNKSVRFYCMEGKKLIGQSVITCKYGQWDHKLPTCLSPRKKPADYSTCGVSPYNHRGRIVGGNRAGRGTWPWQVGIYKVSQTGNLVLVCGGALIARRWVLTVAASFYQRKSPLIPNMYTIKVGDDDVNRKEPWQQELVAERIFLHPSFGHSPLYDNDIALIRLPDRIQLGPFVRPVCLPKQNDDLLQPGKIGIVAGWGRTQVVQLGQVPRQRKIKSRFLMHTAQTIQSESLCAQKTNFYFNSSVTFCVGNGKGGNDTCAGDSGGSLVRNVLRDDDQHRWVSVGLVSWGEGCGMRDKYSYFTKVVPFVNWIHKTIQENP